MENQIEPANENLNLATNDIFYNNDNDPLPVTPAKQTHSDLPAPPNTILISLDRISEQDTRHTTDNNADAMSAAILLHDEVVDLREMMQRFSLNSKHGSVDAYGLPNADLLLAGLEQSNTQIAQHEDQNDLAANHHGDSATKNWNAVAFPDSAEARADKLAAGGDRAAAVQLYTEEVKRVFDQFGNDNPIMARLETKIGDIEKDNGNLRLAENHYTYAMQSLQKFVNAQHIPSMEQTAELRSRLSDCLAQAKDFSGAAVHLKHRSDLDGRIDSLQQTKDHVYRQPDTLLQLGRMYQQAANQTIDLSAKTSPYAADRQRRPLYLQLAADAFEEALLIHKRNKTWNIDAVPALIALGEVLENGHHSPDKRSSNYYSEALRLQEEAYGDRDPRLEPLLKKLVYAYRADGMPEWSAQAAERILDLKQHAVPKDDRQIAKAHQVAAREQEAADNLPAAEKHYRDALALLERNQIGRNHTDVADAMIRLSRVLSKQGKHADALQFRQAQITMDGLLLGPTAPGLAISLERAGDLQVKLQNSQGAVISYQRATKIIEANSEPVSAELLSKLAIQQEQSNRLMELKNQK